MTRRRALALGGAAAAAAAVALALRPVPALEIENAARGRAWLVTLGAEGAFSVTYHHSMYDAPVTEDFVVSDGHIVLREVSSPSAAVREYFGITGSGERHRVTRTMDAIVFRVAAGTVQRLVAGGAERSFLAFGDHGDRLVVRPARTTAIAAITRRSVDGAPARP